MVSIGNDVDRDADAAGHHQLVTGAMNRFDQSPAEFSCVLKVECDQTRRRMALIEGVDRFNENRSSIRQKQQLADRFAGREKIGPLIKVNLDLVFRLELRDDPRGGLIDMICASLLSSWFSNRTVSRYREQPPVRPIRCAPQSTHLQFNRHKGSLTVTRTVAFR
jgi:hypothetical protein